MPWVNQEKCIGCGACISSCPAGAISLKDRNAMIDQELCMFCGNCLSACPQNVIRPNSENPNLRGRHNRHAGLGKGRFNR